MDSKEILTSLKAKLNSADHFPNQIVGIMSEGILTNQEITKKVVQDSSYDDFFKSDEFLKIPAQIFNPYRLLIIIALWKWGSLDFSSLRQGAKLKTDGNLANHMRVLESLNIVVFKKEFEGRRPKTFYKLTEYGKTIFLKLQSTMTGMLKEELINES